MSGRPFYYYIAKVVRVISVPPVMVAALILILSGAKPEMFASWVEVLVAIALLAIVPVLAYPLWAVIPPLKAKGREGQRTLAMYLSMLGYVSVFVYGLIAHVSDGQMLIYSCYMISVLIITILNKLVHLRASGHACSVTGPLVLTAYFLGIGGIIVGALLWALILWASLITKRHTLKEFLLGTASCLVAFIISLLIF